MGCCGRKRRRKRTKRADALRFLYKIAKVESDADYAKALTLDSLGIAGGGMIGEAIGRRGASRLLQPSTNRTRSKLIDELKKAKKLYEQNSGPILGEITAASTPAEIKQLASRSAARALEAGKQYNASIKSINTRAAKALAKRRGIIGMASLLGLLAGSAPGSYYMSKHMQEKIDSKRKRKGLFNAWKKK